MNKQEIKERIDFLIKELNRHSFLYYVKSTREISDPEYDRLFDELSQLEKENPEFINEFSPTQRVGCKVVSSLNTLKHRYPLLSLDKASEWEAIKKFGLKILRILGVAEKRLTYVLEPKYDGATLNVIYDNGKFVRAVLRGDGFEGDDVTHNVKHIKSVPMQIDYNGYLEVRGEVYMPFDKFMDMYTSGSDKKYSNPRNMVSGVVQVLDSAKFAKYPIDVIFYDLAIEDKSAFDFKTDEEQIVFLKKLGFKTTDYILCNGLKEVFDICQSYYQNKIVETDGFNILQETHFNTDLIIKNIMVDGLVAKINDLSVREELGLSNHSPNWGFAFKFPSIKAKTKLLSVVWSVGQEKVSPKGLVEPVKIGGTTITSVTLNNLDYIKDLKINDKVIIERCNDVIPGLYEILFNERTGEETDIEIPTVCPECGEKLIVDYPQLFCTNDGCKGKLSTKLLKFASRDCMDIEIGEETINDFIERGYLNKLSDLYFIKNYEDEILKIKGYGKKTLDKIYKGLEESKGKEFWKLIYGLSIPQVGMKSSKDLARNFKNIRNLMKATKGELMELGDIGDVTSDNIVNFFSKQSNIDIVETFISLGLMVEDKKNETASGKLKGLIFIVTGKFSIGGQREVETIIEQNGGEIAGSVSAKLNYLVYGENFGSKKTKAEKLVNDKKANIEIIDEKQFIELINS